MEKDIRVNIKLNIRITKGLSRYILTKLSDPIGKICMELDGERVLITKAELITEDPHEKEQMLTKLEDCIKACDDEIQPILERKNIYELSKKKLIRGGI